MLVCQPLGWLPRHDAPPTLPRKQNTPKLPSRLHRPLNFCESAGYGERCILHASFTPFARDTHRASPRYGRCFQSIRIKSVKIELLRAQCGGTKRDVKDG